jgi:signal transduction histidine kinase
MQSQEPALPMPGLVKPPPPATLESRNLRMVMDDQPRVLSEAISLRQASAAPPPQAARVPTAGRLSVRLLGLTVLFVLLVEAFIYLPSVARHRSFYLGRLIDAAHLAVFTLDAAPSNTVSQDLADRLLAHVGAHGIVVHLPDKTLMLDTGKPGGHIDATYDLRDAGLFTMIRDGMEDLFSHGNRVLRIVSLAPKDPNAVVEVFIDEAPMRVDMAAYAQRVLTMSLIVSLATGVLLFVSLQWLLVAPLRRLIGSMTAFREDPESVARIIAPSRRRDELGLAERELATLQETVRQALRQKERLAALGMAVTKINHDLRNILSTARLLSDSILDSAAPEVRRVAPNLLASIDRAVALCTATLTFTRDGAPPVQRTRFVLAELLGEVIPPARPDAPIHLCLDIPAALSVDADRAQLFRVLQNLVQNAGEAGAQTIFVHAYGEGGMIVVEVRDDGAGLAPRARANLFRPFTGSARVGGTGLGLAIAREILRAHGGDIELGESTAAGTVFRLSLPSVGKRIETSPARSV